MYCQLRYWAKIAWVLWELGAEDPVDGELEREGYTSCTSIQRHVGKYSHMSNQSREQGHGISGYSEKWITE